MLNANSIIMSTLLQATISLLLLGISLAQQNGVAFPVRQPTVTLREAPGVSGVCPSANSLDQLKTQTVNEMATVLNNTVVPEFKNRPFCPCGGAGNWRTLANLDMSDPATSNARAPGDSLALQHEHVVE